MKTLSHFTLAILLNIFPAVHLFAQCAGGTLASQITYDTTAFGNGNASRTFSFPKFDPAVGTLIGVSLNSSVSLQYSYTLENQNSSAKTYKTKIVRTDDIYSDALDPSSVSEVNQTPLVSSVIGAFSQLNYGPASMNYTVDNTINDGRVVNFMGTGSIDFNYETGTSASVQGPLPWQLNFNSVADTVHFSITYQYCASTLLSANLLFFSAVAQAKNTVQLNWRQAEMENGRIYNLQVSTDGSDFTTVAAIKENASGAYAYSYVNSTAKKLYFRIAQKSISGEIKYSNVRVIIPAQQGKPGVQVFPSMYTGGNLQVNFPERGDWQINIYALDGRKLTENHAQNTSGASLQLSGKFTNGIYIVETLNTHNRQREITRIVVQR